jgi:uncharacterized phage-associated protein
VTPAIADFLGAVRNTYGGCSAGRLRNMTHSEPPWQRSFESGARSAVIAPESMRDWFRQLPARAA